MIKQVIVVRGDLKNTQGHRVRTGKIIAQACHASMAFLSKRLRNKEDLTPEELDWVNGIFTKICLKVEDDTALLSIHDAAKKAGLESHLITDNGQTEFGGVPTNTCLAIGPHAEERINPITGHLSTY